VAEFTDADLQGSRFWRVDLSGSRLHGVVLQNVKITDAWVDDVDLSGRIRRLVVNEVDVTDFVREELDKRHPERRMLAATDVAGLRAAWAMIEERALATVARARALPPAALDESVDGEFSFIQTLRHLLFATDRWITGPVFGDPDPFHPLGYPHDDPEKGRAIGLDVDATPTFDEVLELRQERLARVAGFLRGASQDDLMRTVASPNGGTTSVMGCLHVVLDEEWAHDRYANRDLDVLATTAP
jgi:DinB superfamily/Pentapeptide repeats (8 copies)